MSTRLPVGPIMTKEGQYGGMAHTSPVPKENTTDYHYWIGDGYDGRPIWEHIVCQAPHADQPTLHGVFHVTIDKTLVGCQECLEYIHA